MTRLARIVLVTSTLILPLGGCASVGDAIDPTEWFASAGDLFNSKKKLPGDRKPVFPQGVPGVAQGIPQDLVKGNQPTQESGFASTDPQSVGSTPQQSQPKQKAAAKTEEYQPAPREKAKPKPKPKPATVEQPPPPAQERQPTTARRAPEPQPQQQPQQQSGGNAVQWPDPPPQRSSSQSPGIQWPDPPPMR
jgi:hypothetical protein